jgi:Flp pilus assembly protein TadG
MAACFGDTGGARAKRKKDSGQALVEFALSATMMLVLVFGLVDFSRAIYIAQVIANLTGEGSTSLHSWRNCAARRYWS